MDCFKKIITNYDYADRLKPGGFVIDGKPALTQIDPVLVGDYVIMVVRDPLLVYGCLLYTSCAPAREFMVFRL